MKQLALVISALVMTGCAQVDNYQDVVQAPPPAGLKGYWQSSGPQSKLVSPQAIASLIITEQGDTLDCRQWQRTIAVPGKLTLLSDAFTNVTSKLDIYPIGQDGNAIEYDGMTLQRVAKPTAQCIVAMARQTWANPGVKAQAAEIEQSDDPDAALNAAPLAAANAATAAQAKAQIEAKAATTAAAAAKAEADNYEAHAVQNTQAPKEGSIVAPEMQAIPDNTTPASDDSSELVAPATDASVPTSGSSPATGRFIRVPPAGTLTIPDDE